MKKFTNGEILSNLELDKGIFQMVINTEITKNAKPGQFINVYTDLGHAILPRPISICEINKEEETLTLIFQVVGLGTEHFSGLTAGQEIKILGPLGNGFEIVEEECNHVLVGGGIGIPPLLEVCKNIKGKKTVFLGARTKPVLIEEFEKLGADVHVATDDGSFGHKGNVVELMEKVNPSVDVIYSCGPKIMLKFVTKWALEKGIDPQVSMEERMACGIGACVGCVCKTKKASDNDYENAKVCKDGPVFKGSEVVWE